MAAHEIGLDEVANAVGTANVNLPTGTMYGADQTYMLQANGQLFRATAYGPTIIAYRSGNPVRLNQVARVYDGVENDNTVECSGGNVFEETIARESVDLKSRSFLKYYPTDAGSGTRVPIIPISFGVDRNHDFGRAEFGVSVVELGTPPATLTLLSEMLPDPDEKLSKLLIAAALAGAGRQ